MAKVFENGISSTTSGSDSFIYSDIIINGDVHWVDSVSGNDSNDGKEETPLATLGQAITNATANNGDVIVIKAGHSESLSSSLGVSKAGLKIYGLGSGTTRPTFTITGNVDGMDVTGARCEINNLYFPASTSANTSRINVGAAGVKIKSCGFLCGASDLETITLPDAADDCEINSCTFQVTADGPDSAIEIESATLLGLKVISCSFDANSLAWDNAAIYSTVAHTEFVYDSVTLTNGADIVHTAAAKGWVSNLIAGDSSHIQI